jgi:hypothetical protein
MSAEVFQVLADTTHRALNRVVVTGNTSFNTNSTGKSVDLLGTGSMLYVGNYWDVPPTALLPIISN